MVQIVIQSYMPHFLSFFWVLDDEGVDTGGTSSNESNSPIK